MTLEEPQQIFEPVRKKGLIYHGIAVVILLLIAAGSIISGVLWVQGNLFVLLMLVALITLALLPWILYRGFALLNARYILERDGLKIRWGLRSEDIPVTSVEWVRPAQESGFLVPLPVIHWPGAILGSRHVQGLGDVEFIASDPDSLILITTPDKVYAISPLDVRYFETSFQRTLEMGSLSPLVSRSAKPIAFLQSVWSDGLARILLLTSLVLTFLLWIITGFVIANHTLLPLGYTTQGLPGELIRAEQMLLLPVINTFILVMDLSLGMYFFRRLDENLVAYLLWIGGSLTSVLLIIAVFLFSAAG